METDPCPTCAGTGETFIDCADQRGEHYTRAVDCPGCAEPRQPDDETPEPDERDFGVECAWSPGTVWHERTAAKWSQQDPTGKRWEP